MSRRRIIFAVLLATCVVLLILSISFPVNQNAAWMDAVTGSMKYRTTRLFGFDDEAVITPSPLGEWLIDREGSIQYDWRKIQGDQNLIWGHTVTRSHGRAPVIFRLRGERLRQFVESSSDDQIRVFIQVMREGTKVQRDAAVEAALATAGQAIFP